MCVYIDFLLLLIFLLLLYISMLSTVSCLFQYVHIVQDVPTISRVTGQYSEICLNGHRKYVVTLCIATTKTCTPYKCVCGQ